MSTCDGYVCTVSVTLLKTLNGICRQVWYADDATGCDKLDRLRVWDALLLHGPKYGYFPKPSKCILLVKLECLERANQLFKGTEVTVEKQGSKDSGVELITNGTRHLGAAVGTEESNTAL